MTHADLYEDLLKTFLEGKVHFETDVLPIFDFLQDLFLQLFVAM